MDHVLSDPREKDAVPSLYNALRFIRMDHDLSDSREKDAVQSL